MKNILIMGVISLLIIACNHNAKTELQVKETQAFDTSKNKNKSKSDIVKSEISDVFFSGENFLRFVENPHITYVEKDKIILDFYINLELFDRQTVIESLASIGSTVDWDVDLISLFKHEMQKTFKQDSELLCKTFNNLDLQEVASFSRFYIGNVIWNDDFPREIDNLQSCNQEAYGVFINTFVDVYEKQSKRKYQYDFIVNDKDGSTNVRKEATTQSDIVTVVKNTKPVTSLWRTGDWVFVTTANHVGYIHVGNITNKYKYDQQDWYYGKYLYDNYKAKLLTDNWVREKYTINLSANACHIKINQLGKDRDFGYKDFSFSCHIQPTSNPNIIEIVRLPEYTRLYQIHKGSKNDLLFRDVNYYSHDKELYLLEKAE